MRYFCHLRDATSSILDDEGIERPPLAPVRAEIIQALDELMRENPDLAQESTGWTLDVADASGTVLFSIEISDPMR